MLENYVQKLASRYLSMTSQEKRTAYKEVAGGLVVAFLAKFFDVPGYITMFPLGYAVVKGAPVVAYTLQSKLTGPSSVIISSNEEVKNLISHLRKTHQELEAFKISVYSERDGKLVLDTGGNIGGIFGYVSGLIPGLRNVVSRDPLDTIEAKFRGYLNEITSHVVNLAQVANAKKVEIVGLEQKLEEMKGKEWGIAQIMNYMLEKVPEINKDTKVMEFFTSDMEKSLTPEQYNKRREGLIKMLYEKLEIMKLGQEAMGAVAITAREVYFRALQQADAFTSIKPQLQAARDTTLTATDTSQLSTSARDYIIELIKGVGEANKVLLEGLSTLDNTLIASPETVKALQNTVEDFYKRLKEAGLINPDQYPVKGLLGDGATVESKI